MTKVYKKAQALVYFLTLSCCEQVKEDSRKAKSRHSRYVSGIGACLIILIVFLILRKYYFHAQAVLEEVYPSSNHPIIPSIASVKSLTVELRKMAKQVPNATLLTLKTALKNANTAAKHLQTAVNEMQQIDVDSPELQKAAAAAHDHAMSTIHFFKRGDLFWLPESFQCLKE